MNWLRGVSFSLAMLAAASCTTTGGPLAPAFVGTWHQFDADCPGASPVRELIFRADGRFSVTWTPFETYQDYWGTWRYDRASRVLTLAVDYGNYVPADLILSGVVNVDAGHLSLGAISLGSPREGARCTVPFHH